MSSRSAPRLPLWIDDLLSHIHMTGEPTLAVGARVLLWCAAFKRGGTLPNDDAQLARWAMLSLEEWDQVKGFILPGWSLSRNRQTYTVHRVQKECRRIREMSAVQAEKGRRSWAKRQNNLHDAVQPDHKFGSTPSYSSTSSCINTTPLASLAAPTRPADPPGFPEFWQAYPRKVGRGAAVRAWTKLRPPIEAVLGTLAWQRGSPQWTDDGGRYVPNPATWLNRQGWLDEPSEQRGPEPKGFDGVRTFLAKHGGLNGDPSGIGAHRGALGSGLPRCASDRGDGGSLRGGSRGFAGRAGLAGGAGTAADREILPEDLGDS